jgi:hypothetical protein
MRDRRRRDARAYGLILFHLVFAVLPRRPASSIA